MFAVGNTTKKRAIPRAESPRARNGKTFPRISLVRFARSAKTNFPRSNNSVFCIDLFARARSCRALAFALARTAFRLFNLRRKARTAALTKNSFDSATRFSDGGYSFLLSNKKRQEGQAAFLYGARRIFCTVLPHIKQRESVEK